MVSVADYIHHISGWQMVQYYLLKKFELKADQAV